MPATESQLENVKQEIQQFVDTIPATIATREEYNKGVAFVAGINKQLKDSKAWFDELLAPVKEAKQAAINALKKQEAMRDKILSRLVQADQSLRQNLLAFDRAEKERARKEQERQNKLYEQRMARAEAKGKDPSEVKAPLVVAAPPSSTKSIQGSFSVKTIKKLVITDESKIPEQYFDRIRNDKRIEQALRAEIDVPGATLVEELTSAVRTN